MLSILGFIVVSGSIIVGYLLEGGHMEVLFQPIELLIIGGAAGGSLLISSPPSLLKAIMRQLIGVIKAHTPQKKDYMELLGLLFELMKIAKANPLSLEAHIDKPESSDIFNRYPGVLHNHHAVNLLCDTMKIQLSSPLAPHDLEDLIDTDINTAHAEEHKCPATVQRIGDAMPGLGIVAAVLGVVITMGKLTQGKEVIGHSVAAALVGTFLGVLGSYGFMQPLAAKMEENLGAEAAYLNVIKAAILTLAKGAGPKVCVEAARRAVPPEHRPTFNELDEATSAGGAAAKAA